MNVNLYGKIITFIILIFTIFFQYITPLILSFYSFALLSNKANLVNINTYEIFLILETLCAIFLIHFTIKINYLYLSYLILVILSALLINAYNKGYLDKKKYETSYKLFLYFKSIFYLILFVFAIFNTTIKYKITNNMFEYYLCNIITNFSIINYK